MRKYIGTILLFFLNIGILHGQVTLDGVLDDAYTSPANVQQVGTEFGNNADNDILSADGSELDAVYSIIRNGNLFLFFSGNLQTNFNKFDLFIDYTDGGQNQLRGDNPDVDFDGLNRMGDDGTDPGMKFDSDFAADFYLTFGAGNDPVELFANAAEILTTGGGTGEFIGSTGGGNNSFTSTSTNFSGITIAYDNSNIVGVAGIGNPNDSDPASVTTGFEIKIPLSLLGNASSLKVTAFVNGGGHDFVSNQVMASLPAGTGNLGEPRTIDFTSITGNQFIEVNGQDLTGTEGYRLLSVPTSGSTFADLLDPIWTQGIAAGADITNGDPNVFTWDDGSTNADATNFTAMTDLTATPGAGTGFLAFVFEDDEALSDGIQGGFPKTLSLSGSEHSSPVTPTLNQNDGGFTLLGNPFAATIDFDELTTNDLNGTVYVWDPSVGISGDWVSWDGSNGDLDDGLIAPFQGFFVENATSVTNPTVSIEEADKVSGGSFRGKENSEEPLAARLELNGSGFVNSTWISFTGNGSTQQRVLGDALQLESLNARFAQLATTKLGGGQLLDINRLPLAIEDAVELPVHVNSSESGSFTLTATDLNIPEGLNLYFNDLDKGESVIIDESFSYTLDITANRKAKKSEAGGLISAPATLTQTTDEESAAYSITIEPNVITSVDEEGLNLPEKVKLDQNFPNPFNPSTTIRFALPESQQVSLEVYDLLGRRVAQLLRNEVRSAGSHSVNFDAASLSSGVYIYQLRAEGGATITRKLTLIK